jgi:hypothetical protein
LLCLLVLLPGEVSLARLTATTVSTHSLGTDTLDPPTSLAAIGGPNVALTWSATVDSYAAGYELQRSTASGGPYSVVASISPRTTVAATDSPAINGTYYYVLRSVFESWTSVNSNQASAAVTVGATGTGYRTCTVGSNAADTGGNGNGYEVSPSNACGDDAATASDVNTNTNAIVSCTNAGKDRHRFWDFSLGVPASVTSVNGIEVRLDEGMNNNGGTNQVCVELSWDGGTTWTTPKAQPLTAGAVITTYILGAANDTWGRSWSGANLSNANFRVRLTDVTSQPNKTFILENLAIQVTYTP